MIETALMAVVLGCLAYLLVINLVAFAFVLSLFLKQIELRRSNSHQRPNSTAAEGAGGAGPEGDDQNDEIAAPTHV